MIGDSSPIGDDDLQGFIDDRLEPDRRRIVEAWLGEHPDVAARVAAQRADREDLRARLAAKGREPIPARLRISTLKAARRDRFRRGALSLAAAVTLFVAGIVADRLVTNPARVTAVADIGSRLATSERADALAGVAEVAHRTFVVEAVHPVEVDASREAHLVQWLSKRLGRSLAAPDLGRFGWRLMGGRLLTAGGGPAAQLMYEDEAGHRLTVWITGGEEGRTAFRFRSDGGTSTFAWIDDGFGFAVTAPLDRERLQIIAEAVHHRLDRPRDGA